MPSKSYSNNLDPTVNVDFVLNKPCNISLYLSFNFFVKGTKALKLYQIYMLQKSYTNSSADRPPKFHIALL